jgi:hypothetical protein
MLIDQIRKHIRTVENPAQWLECLALAIEENAPNPIAVADKLCEKERYSLFDKPKDEDKPADEDWSPGLFGQRVWSPAKSKQRQGELFETKPEGEQKKRKDLKGQGHFDFAKKDNCQWRTVGGSEGEDGKKHGGSPMCVGAGGTIEKGSPKLAGKAVGNLKGNAEAKPEGKTNRGQHLADLNRSKDYARAVARKKARKEGLDPAELDAEARFIIEQDHETAKATKHLLQAARQSSKKGWGHDISNLSTLIATGKVEGPDQIKGFDVVAESVAAMYPEFFADYQGDEPQRLYDLMAEGNPKPISEEAAYEQALDQMLERKHSQPAEDEVVPFAAAFAGPMNVVPAGNIAGRKPRYPREQTRR